MSVNEIYRRLKNNPSGHVYTVASIPGRDNVYLGSDTAGHPCLFVTASERMSDPPLRTAQVSLQLSQEYNIALDEGQARRQSLHAMFCESLDKTDLESFLTLIEAFLARYQGKQIEGEHLSLFFRSMVKLFSVTQARDLQAERQGLWGELFMMRQTRGFRFWAPFWHSEVTRLFDFSNGQKMVEVKTVVGQLRIHHFSHRQIYAVGGEEIVISSLLLREEDAGLSLRVLIDECRESLLGTSAFLKLERAVRQAGMEDSDVVGPKFDAAQAETLMYWFRSTDAPHFRMAEPPGVSETRYKVDLSTAPVLPHNEFEQWIDTWRLKVPIVSM